MTTIASDGRTVAADGQETWGSEVVSTTREKVRFVAGKVYAFTGLGALMDPCIKWVQEGADPSKAPEGKGDNASWGVCIFASNDVIYYSSGAPYPRRYSYPFSIGAGCDYATGAMMAGADSKRAVEIASEKDIHTGGKITVVPIPMAEIAEAAE